MNVSSVSPERCETNCRYPAWRQIRMASRVSVTVPIWLSLISEAFAIPRSMALARNCGSFPNSQGPLLNQRRDYSPETQALTPLPGGLCRA
jgi:hypothetical protein